ncbi:MAG TPA: agglutinin biogenesis protein MshI [Burkholderiales bacterium]|nr:agglutinin biogenesis protein MshI [Burkholderiales bacterium]
MTAYRCTTVLAPSEYQILQVEAPNVKREELKSAVRWRIKDMIDYPVNDATIDVLDMPAHAAPQRSATMYVVAARSEAVKRVMGQFAAAGLPLVVIDIPDTCQRNVAALYESPGRALLSLSFDEEAGLMTITAGGELFLSRRLDIGYPQLGDSAERRAIERVLVELQRSLDHFERNFSSLPIERILVAPMPHAEPLVEHLRGQIQLPVLSMDLGEVMDLPPQYLADPPEARARWFRLIGAGLRVEPAVP